MSKKSKLPQTEHPTTEQLLDFLETLTFNADYYSYMKEILKRVARWREIEKLSIAYKEILRQNSENHPANWKP